MHNAVAALSVRHVYTWACWWLLWVRLRCARALLWSLPLPNGFVCVLRWLLW